MNCNECKNEMYQLFDDNCDTTIHTGLLQHLATCPACMAEYEAAKAAIDFLKPGVTVTAPLLLKQNIIQQLTKKEITMKQDTTRRATISPLVKRLLAVAAVAAAIVLAIPLFNNKNDLSGNSAKASSLFEMAIKAGDMVRNMIIQCSIRTDANDNFALVGKDLPMVQHTIIKNFGQPEHWRVEKPGRTVLFDGSNQYLWVPETRQAVKGPKDANYIDWLKILLDPTSILWKEKEEAKNSGAAITIKDEPGKQIVTITSKAQGNFMNDYLKNKSVAESDNKREYVFDSKTKLLQGLKIWLVDNKTETLVFELTHISYNTTIAPATFAITLPANVQWQMLDLAVTSENFSNVSSKRAAELIFDAMAKNDFETDKAVWAQFSSFSVNSLANTYGGLQVIKIGESFKSGKYPGEFVPYEVKLKDGSVKKMTLALRNDNSNKVWIVDGGI